MNFDETFTLVDGRTLGYASYGAAGGAPVVALHGSPDSRVIWRLADQAAHHVGVRLIAPDRPGFGISDPNPGGTVLSWCHDLTQLVDHLDYDEFGLLAISGGGIYAAAYAWQHPERVSRLGLFSVLGPLDGPDAMSEMSRRIRVSFRLVRRFPALTGPMASGLCRMASRNPKRAAGLVTRSRPVEDRDIIARPEMQEVLFDNLPNQFRDPQTIAAEVRTCGLWDPIDGDIDPTGLVTGLVHAGRRNGGEAYRFTDCTGLTQTENGWIVHTNQGDVECQSIVNAAGYRVHQVGDFYGLESAVSSMEHQYFLTEELPELAELGRRVSLIQDPGDDFYSRQEHHGLLVGVYEQGCKTWGREDIPVDFANKLEPPDLDRLEDNMMRIFDRLPVLQTAGITSIVNGPITYSGDGAPLVGRLPGRRNAYCMLGLRSGVGEGGGLGKVLAEIIVDGQSEWDMGPRPPPLHPVRRRGVRVKEGRTRCRTQPRGDRPTLPRYSPLGTDVRPRASTSTNRRSRNRALGTPMADSLEERIAGRALAYVVDPPRGLDPVIDLASPAELLSSFDRAVTLGFDEKATAHDDDSILEAVDLVIKHSVHTSHPRFVNQNFAGPDPVSVVGDWLGAALNTTGATFEAAPVFTLMESAVLSKLGRIAGYLDPDTDQVPTLPPGLFCPGGSTATLYALQLARHRLRPDIRRTGGTGERLTLFVSDAGHYAATKSAALLGLGTDAVIKVESDDGGAIIPDALEEAVVASLEAGQVPFAIIGTAGTTVTSAFDDLNALADVARDHGLWLHIDGCYGGSALFSPTHRHLLDGVERSDSFVWNLHKMMGMTQQCTALLVREPELLAPCFAVGADYLFQPDKLHAEYDSGDRTFQCARRVDVLKFWLAWKHHGDAGFAARIDHAVGMATHARRRIAASDGEFESVAGTFTNVVFGWIPPKLRPLPLSPAAIRALSPGVRDELHALAPRIKARMQAEGTAMVGFQPIEGLNTFRLLFMNPAVADVDVDALLDRVSEYGHDVYEN